MARGVQFPNRMPLSSGIRLGNDEILPTPGAGGPPALARTSHGAASGRR